MAAAIGLYTEGLNVSASTTAWVDVCEIAAGSFTANKKYLILATAHLRSDTSAANEGRLRIVHGTTPTEFTDSYCAYEETAIYQDTVVGWLTVWTQPATAELIKLQISVSSTYTFRALLGQIFALKLSDDFTENTDWYYNENLTDLTTTTSYQAQASITVAANGTDDWLVIADGHLTPAATNSSYMMSIFESVAATDQPSIAVEGEDATNENRNHLLMRVFTPSAGSHTFSARFKHGAVAHIIKSSRIFAFNLNKMAAHGFSYSIAEEAPAASPSWTTTRTLSVTPTVTGNWFYMGYFGNDNNVQTDDLQTRVQVNPDGSGLISDPAYGDTSPGQDNWDPTDVLPFHIFKLRSLSTGAARPINLDVQMVAGTTLRVEERCLVAFSMEMGGGDITVYPTGNVATSTAGSLAITGGAIVSPTGIETTSTVGTVTAAGGAIVSPTGNVLTLAAGTISMTGTANVTPTGTGTTFSIGSLAISGNANFSLTGTALTSAVGDVLVGIGLNVDLTGQQIASALGSVGVTGTANIIPTGSQMTGSVGTVAITGGSNVAISGQSLSVTVGSSTVTGGASVIVSGQGLSVAAGNLGMTGTANVTPTGSSTTALVGDVYVIGEGGAALGNIKGPSLHSLRLRRMDSTGTRSHV